MACHQQVYWLTLERLNARATSKRFLLPYRSHAGTTLNRTSRQSRTSTLPAKRCVGRSSGFRAPSYAETAVCSERPDDLANPRNIHVPHFIKPEFAMLWM